jgi:hypothetical protein
MIMVRQNNPETANEARAPLARGGILGGTEFGQVVERRIMERTSRRIRQLRVEVYTGRVVVQGQTLWYYAKQLALQAVQEALREAGVTAIADVRITVSAPVGRGGHLTPV